MSEAEKQISKPVGLVEQFGCACLNLGCLVIVFINLSIVGLVWRIFDPSWLKELGIWAEVRSWF